MTDSVLVGAPLLIAAIVMAVRFVGCKFETGGIPGAPGTGTPGTSPSVPAMFSGSGSLVVRAFPPTSSVTTQYTTPGSPNSYPIPDWCNYVDLILLGGGGGGITNGSGGSGGSWAPVTLTRGVDIPWETTSITFTVGSGGQGGSDGDPTTATATGLTTAPTAAGGTGGGSTSAEGGSPMPATLEYLGQPYPGGQPQVIPDLTGNAPGGGGAGGPFGGGTGAPGAAWVVARQF